MINISLMLGFYDISLLSVFAETDSAAQNAQFYSYTRDVCGYRMKNPVGSGCVNITSDILHYFFYFFFFDLCQKLSF